ncbi:MAG: hypothetical protein JW820_05340 [Spirochaetales bacterium]|nr:hypothetical protein [Spirochaetales bacterium]
MSRLVERSIARTLVSMVVVAQALGANRHEDAATLARHAMLLRSIVGAVLGVGGWSSIRPLFTRLGASGEVLLMAEQYMRIWYVGMVFRVLQVLFNDVVIGTGHTKASSSLMVLKPLLIFGLLGLPKMGIRGAALATVFSEAVVMARSPVPAILASWGRILRIGAPSTLSSVLTPLSNGVLTRLAAAFGVGGRRVTVSRSSAGTTRPAAESPAAPSSPSRRRPTHGSLPSSRRWR